jgi:hypothetical protein
MPEEEDDESLGVEQLPQDELEAEPGASIDGTPGEDAAIKFADQPTTTRRSSSDPSPVDEIGDRQDVQK